VFKKQEKFNMSDLNEKLAQEAAELINGGEWRDGKWYSDDQRDAWRRALKPAANRIEKLEAALREIAEANSVQAGPDKDMYRRWRRVATNAIDIACKALEDKQ
jgi:hypothetical protein